MSSSAPWSDLGIDAEPPSDLALSVVTTTDAWEGEAPLTRVAWTARDGRAVIGLAGTEGLGDAMVGAYLEELLLRTLGAPREPWLLDGLVAMGVGGAPGRPLLN